MKAQARRGRELAFQLAERNSDGLCAVQADLFTSAGRTDAPEVLAEHEVDYTPPPVAIHLLLGLELALRELGADDWTPHHAWSPSAGSGCWPRVMRVLWPHLHITGTDVRASELANLERACDVAGICDAFADDGPTRGRLFDFIADNIPFSGFGAPDFEKRCRYWPAEIAARSMLAPSGLIMFYGLTQQFQTEDAAANLAIFPPFLCIRCGGRPQHRGVGTTRRIEIPEERRVVGGPTHETRKNGGDSREYCGWVWRASDYDADFAARGPRRRRLCSWTTVQLPVLPHELRVWHPNAVPGTYTIEPALVDEVRKYL